MPLVNQSTYKSPRRLPGSHIQTIYPSLFRTVHGVNYTRERIDTPDDDFLDLDWVRNDSRKLVILSHGLEGNTERAYMRGMARRATESDFDVLAWNFRGCSEEVNRRLYSYHSGATHDLDTVIKHAAGTGRYDSIDLVGFSMGGNITLKYLGENGANVDRSIRKAVALSVPIDLASSAKTLARSANWIYMRRFLKMLGQKIRKKKEMFPGEVNDDGYENIHNFQQFDDRYTAPLHGFRDAEDYWRQCSSLFYLESIAIPCLLVNAANDPFLTPECMPTELAKLHSSFYFEMPAAGGHVGFARFASDGYYWSEHRALAFIEG